MSLWHKAPSLEQINRSKTDAGGLEINANHLRASREGWVTGRVTPIHTGRSTQIW